jgi:hypothetical protein
MKKRIQVFSDGSISFIFENCSDLKKIKMYEKDHKNLFLKKKRSLSIKPSDYSSKYKNKYF